MRSYHKAQAVLWHPLSKGRFERGYKRAKSAPAPANAHAFAPGDSNRGGGKKRQGAKPPELPGGLVDFLLMKIDSNAATRISPYNEGAPGPRGPVGRGTEKAQRPQSPGPQPLIVSSVFMITVGRFS